MSCGGDSWVTVAALELSLRCLQQRQLDSQAEELAYDRACAQGAPRLKPQALAAYIEVKGIQLGLRQLRVVEAKIVAAAVTRVQQVLAARG